ncbi:MAG: glycosyltransferase [Chitinivibrionales bacterium]|nr:glycosyltransferase [Chitinivibrionales bacterium]
MRILYDHQFFPILPYSGISRYFYELISRVAAQPDIDASLYMGWHNNKYDFNSLAPILKWYFSRSRPALPKTARLFQVLTNAGLSVFSRLSNPDLYHQTFYWHYLPRYKGRRVVTVHDMIYFVFPEYDIRSDPVSRSMAKSIESSNGIIADSESTKRDLMRYLGVREEKIRVIYLANSLVAQADEASPVGMPYVLYVGQRFLWKNFRLLFDVYCSTPAIHRDFALVCFGGAELTEEEKGALTRHGIRSDRLRRFAGSDELLATFYKHASALVYPSQYEGFGLPLLEAMHYGCPVVASNSSSIPEIAGEAAVYFDSDNGDDLRRQLLRCLSDGELSKRLSSMGPEREAQFSWDRCAAETTDFYRTVMGR